MNYRNKKIRGRLEILVLAALVTSSIAGCGKESAEVSTETAEKSAIDGILDSSNMFTDRDKEIGYDEESAIKINMSDDESTADSDSIEIEDNTITDEGTYILTGTLSDGQIVVNAENAKVQLVFNNVDITCETSAAVYVKSAEKVFITTAASSENKVNTSGEFVAIDDNNIDAAIFSKSDLTLNGSGNLEVTCENGHGIVSKDDLVITSGEYVVTASNHALSGKDSARIAGGTFELTAGKDGIHSENTDDEQKGFVYIEQGNFTIVSDGDGIDASYVVEIVDGSFDITAGGGYENGKTPTDNKVTETSDDMGGQKLADKTLQDGGGAPSDMMPPDGDNLQDKGQSTENMTEEDSAISTKGIKSSGAMQILDGEYKINSADDAFHTNATFEMNGGSMEITTGDDGMHADDALVINDGIIDITTSYEGIEGLTIAVNGGNINIVSSDDGLNAAGGADASGFGGGKTDMFASNDDVWIEINGGCVRINAGGDGVDSNGNLTVNAGEVYIDGPSDNGNSAIDYGDNASAYINGGTVVAVGSSGMVETFDEASKQAIMTVAVTTGSAGDKITLLDSSGNEIISYAAAKSYDAIIISTSDLTAGETYTLINGENETTIKMTAAVYSNIAGRQFHK